MDLRDAVALSILPGFPRRNLPELFPPIRAANPPPEHIRLEAVVRHLRIARGDACCALRDARRRAEALLTHAARLRVEAVGWHDARYPSALAAIVDPPPVLWVRGDPTVLASVSVAVVGSRAASRYANEVATWLGTDLAARGVTVVSGLARGVDSAAHRGALTAGRTVAVLGSGVDVVYPPEHGALARAMLDRGALVSELPPGTPPRPRNFPLRNRIISGLSQAIVIVEASARSGSLITARCGLEQGREVMAVPGSVLGERNRGAHALLKDGAKVVEHVDDILEEIGFAAGGAPAGTSSSAERDEDPVLRCMAAGDAYDLDELTARSGIASATLLARLLDLELTGCVGRADGGRFVRMAGKW